jgi:hypothetical protein
MAVFSQRRVALVPQSTWPPRSICAGPTSWRDIFQTWSSCAPIGIGAPCRASVASRRMALSSACRCTSVSITSGAASVKKPAPFTGGSWPGSPSTRIGLPKAIRSRPRSSPTIDTSSRTRRSASRRIGLLVDQELRLVDVLEPQLELGDPRHGEIALGRPHARQVAFRSAARSSVTRSISSGVASETR